MKRLAIFLGILVLFPACTRYVCWIERTFKQAELCDVCYAKEARECTRSQPVYDYLNTIDFIYVLWINAMVFKAHEGLMQGCLDQCEISKQGLESVASFEKEQEEKTCFLVLMDNEKKDWSMTLIVGDEHFAPEKIKGIELDRGYRGILGHQVTRYQRNVYEVEFNKGAVSKKPFSLQLFDGTHRVTFCWNEEC